MQYISTKDLGKGTIQILKNRGYKTDKEIEDFLNFNESNIPSSDLLPDIDKFLNRVHKSIFLGEEITIYADYDCDGASSGAIMVNCLRNLGLKVNFFTNDRFIEGFGMQVDGVKRLLTQYPDTKLIITVDNGIVAFEGVDYANQCGIDVIITDHHEPDQTGALPNAIAIVDCKRYDNKYPFIECCGAGIAYKLMKALYASEHMNDDVVKEQLPYVALATVADCVPLIQENRLYVKEGLKMIGTNKVFNRLAYLLKINKFDEETFGYYIGPIVNANSRLNGNALKPIELFTTKDENRVNQICDELIAVNDLRKKYTQEETDKAIEIIEQKQLNTRKIIIVQDDSFKEGIVGIIAGRLVELYNKPAIVFSRHNIDYFKGSARSLEGFNIKESCDEIADCIENYGGHAMAAGITIKEEKFDEFYDRLESLIDESKIIVPQALDKAVDYEYGMDELNMKMIDEIEILKPFGEGFAPINLCLKDFIVEEKRMLKDIHLKLHNETNQTDVLLFNTGQDLDKVVIEGDLLKVIGTPKVNVFNGKVSYNIILNDINCCIK